MCRSKTVCCMHAHLEKRHSHRAHPQVTATAVTIPDHKRHERFVPVGVDAGLDKA